MPIKQQQPSIFPLSHVEKHRYMFRIVYPDLTDFKANSIELYEQLREVANAHCGLITKKIMDKILANNPVLSNSINIYQFKSIIFEIVKNCIDSVNSAKSKNPNIEAIEIKLVTENDNGQLKIKIKDNGSGVENYEKSKTISMDKFLNPNQSIFPFNFSLLIGSKKSKKPSGKSFEKQLGKVYLLGGLGIGLKDANQIVKAAKGNITIKNRKDEGATIEIAVPYYDPKKVKTRKEENEEKEKPKIVTANEKSFEEILEEIEESEYLLNPKSVNKNRSYGT